jgi:hypothetical protein
MRGRSGWTPPAWKRMLGFLLLVATAALVVAPAAQATNGGSRGYLPDQKDWCLGVTAPELKDVGYLHAFVRLEYWDDCLFPAKSSIEIRSGDSGWQEVGSEYTQSTDRHTKKWNVRTIRLSDLRNNTRYYVRSRIDYTGDDAHTSELTFKTGGDPAREMRAQGNLGAGQGDASIVLSAVIPDTGKITPSAIWTAPSGYDQFSGDYPWSEQTPFAGGLAHECHPFTDNYEKCTWQFKWRVSIGVPRPVPPFMWKDGLAYRLRFCIKNSAYANEFGDQCTKEVSVVPGKASKIDVDQAP